MSYRIELCLTAERNKMKPRILWEGGDWMIAKERLNFWANEHRDEMDRITLRVVGKDAP